MEAGPLPRLRSTSRSGARLLAGRKWEMSPGDILGVEAGPLPTPDRPAEAERGRAVVGSKVKLRFLVFIGSVLGSTSFQCCAIPAEAERGRAVVLEALTAPDFRLERGSQTASDHIDD